MELGGGFMKIYTSYFAKLRKIPESIVPISISLYPPKGYSGEEYKKLAPTSQILRAWKNNPDELVYSAAFYEMLNQYSPDEIYNNLSELSYGRDCVLLCFEKTGSFCHRHLVAKWLTDAGYVVEEWLA